MLEALIHFFTGNRFWSWLAWLYEGLIFFYGISLLTVYALLAILSFRGIRRYLKKSSFTDYTVPLSSPIAPGISVIAPAFNEELSIIMNVRSLLTLSYPLFEVIIINDGSKDKTLEKLIEEFELVHVAYAYQEKIITAPVKRIFKSTNKAYEKLIVIDKENGKSKADASNAGINVALYDYFLCTDVDCILDSLTLVKMIKPFLEKEEIKRQKKELTISGGGVVSAEDKYLQVIATGATLRMVNSCEVEGGRITRVRPPRRLLPRFQEMEYIRAFVLGKMGWDHINAVPNVSGGLGMFDKEIAIKAGGYDGKSFAEDMDMVTRMAAYMKDSNKEYSVKYIPDTLCWTEGPTTLSVFNRQRTRWGRGAFEIISMHRQILFNKSYGNLGLIVFVYYLFYELLAPVIEFTGILYYIYLILTDQIFWPYAIILILFVYTYSIMITTAAILWDQITFRYYKSWGEVIGLCLMAFLEPFLYHPLIVIFALKGYFYFLTGKKHSWGNMQRQGFEQKKNKKKESNVVAAG